VESLLEEDRVRWKAANGIYSDDEVDSEEALTVS
jgi:hypothetical protein